MRATVAAEVEALTRMEVAVYHADGTLRLRGPVLAVTQRGEALRGSEWALQGLELVIHPALYEGGPTRRRLHRASLGASPHRARDD
ncbi:MAG: hypothetical protein IPF99_09355 [Deltaproteobacteria bacterium]|nr:hypothetical protein [Deltaproteobacteria bacterium]